MRRTDHLPAPTEREILHRTDQDEVRREIKAALLDAVRRVNALYAKVSESDWPDVNAEPWTVLESEIDAATEARDAARAIGAITAWENFATEQLRSAVWT